MKANRKFDAADLFCGAGGFTTGAVASGYVNVRLAINHWRPAIYTHEKNHPETRHICARIDDIDPRHDKTLPDLDLLMASPECTHHSNARGGRPIDDQKRATPWHVVLWTEVKRPKWVIVENVREFRDWGPLDDRGRPLKSRKGETFRAWVRALESLGYQVDHQLLNAADFGAATKRVRLFIVARRGKTRRDIPWPVAMLAQKDWRPAWSIIDWSRPCPSIFIRKRPLADKTLRRIEMGLRKFVGEAAEPFIVRMRQHGDGASTGDPLGTITAGGQHHGLAVPFVTQFHNGADGDQRNYSPAEPLRTLDTQNRYGLACPFIVPNFGERDGQEPRSHAIDDPLPAVTGHGAGGLVAPYLIDINHGGHDHRAASMADPLGVVTTVHGKAAVLPFLCKYYGTGSTQGVDEPVDTITTRDRFGLAMAALIETMRELQVIDIGFRMLDVDELARAQGFPDGYYLHGTKAEQVKQVGNSVSPPVAEALCRTVAEEG